MIVMTGVYPKTHLIRDGKRNTTLCGMDIPHDKKGNWLVDTWAMDGAQEERILLMPLDSVAYKFCCKRCMAAARGWAGTKKGDQTIYRKYPRTNYNGGDPT